MVVVVIGVAVMLVHDVLAEQMVRERVAAFLIVGHSNVPPCGALHGAVPDGRLWHGASSSVKMPAV
jgi:hypothetical protein